MTIKKASPKTTSESFPEPFLCPWKEGTLIRLTMYREKTLSNFEPDNPRSYKTLAAFYPEGTTKEIRSIDIRSEWILMYLGLDRYGEPRDIYKWGKSNIVMKLLHEDRIYLVRVHPEWTYKQFIEVTNDQA